MANVSKRFGATQALRSVNLEARSGEVLALIGENGAGKSTLMKVLSGAHLPDEGSMTLLDRPYAPRGPHQARLTGVAMIYQELNLAPQLSVEDNILLGQERRRLGLLDRRLGRKIAREALARLGHAQLDPQTPVDRLSVGMQQVVEIARALASQAKVIIFDEPTSSLTRQDVQQLFNTIRSLRGAGLAIVYISHFLEEIRQICDRFAVLRDGASVGTGEVAGTTDAQIVSLMVGRSVADLFPQVPHQPGEPILSLDGLSGRRIPRNVSLQLRRGEILGIAGLVGAGRTELLRTLFALDPVRSGKVRIGAFTPAATPRARIQAGLGMVSEDRKGEGLAQSRSVADNLTYSRLSPYSRWGWLNLRRRDAVVSDWITRMQIKTRGPDQAIAELSGGTQQKVAIARVLHQQADVLLLDEPTRGIDVGTKAEIYRLIGEAAAAGKAVIFVSSYLPELMATCDSIGVMSRGRLREIRPVSQWTEEAVLTCAIGEEEPVTT
ncbi:MAG TPA: sugar ABC transporter ATP-binding protein [Pirellulales bacterium]|jgi:ribose transport system ATP-binding protein|nr:sugar ABC transporter ATP-binding protein [Pirellulales bacterium]